MGRPCANHYHAAGLWGVSGGALGQPHTACPPPPLSPPCGTDRGCAQAFGGIWSAFTRWHADGLVWVQTAAEARAQQAVGCRCRRSARYPPAKATLWLSTLVIVKREEHCARSHFMLRLRRLARLWTHHTRGDQGGPLPKPPCHGCTVGTRRIRLPPFGRTARRAHGAG